MRNSAWLLVLVVVALAGNAALGDMYLQGLGGPTGLGNVGTEGSSAANDRFLDSSSFIGEPYNWSGVGAGSGGGWATMISSTYFVSANHYHPGPGSTVTFYTTNSTSGPSYTYTVASGEEIGDSDLYLGKLSTAVNASIATYPVLDLPSQSDYINRTIWAYGVPNRVGLNNIADITDTELIGEDTICMEYNYYANGGQQGANECYLESGDSGGPSFAVVNGSLALLGTHFYDDGAQPGNGYVSGDTFVPYYISQLDADMVGAQVMTVVPEPASLILLGVGVAAFFFHSCRRRRAKA